MRLNPPEYSQAIFAFGYKNGSRKNNASRGLCYSLIPVKRNIVIVFIVITTVVVTVVTVIIVG